MKKIFIIFLPFLFIIIFFNLFSKENIKEKTTSTKTNFIIKEEDLEKQISKSIKATGERYSKTELTTEGHITLGKEIKDKILTIYLISSVSNFEFQDNEFNLISGASLVPTVIKYELNSNNNRYKELEYIELLDDKNYNKIFPKKYIDKLNNSKGIYKDIETQQLNQAREYLETINRNANINIEHVKKEYLDIPVDYINKSINDKFPNWEGEIEGLENGKRIIYSTTIDTNNNYIFTKSYKDGAIIESFELDNNGNKID